MLGSVVFTQPVHPESRVEQTRLMDTLRELPVKRAGLGDDEDRAGLAATEALIAAKLRGLGFEPRVQEVKWAWPTRAPEGPDRETDTGGEAKPRETSDAGNAVESEKKQAAAKRVVSHNLIVDVVGSERPRDVLILSAHYDAVPGCPGADDDGTGTAALLELARVFVAERDAGNPPKRTIRLCFFTLEELGAVGSMAYVRTLKAVKAKDDEPSGAEQPPQEVKRQDDPATPDDADDARERIIGMVSLEMLGYFSDEPNSQRSPIPRMKLPDGSVFEPPTVGDNIALVGIAKHKLFSQRFAREMKEAAPGLKVTTVDFAPIPVPDLLRSDHRPFIMAGLPGTMLTDTANFRNPNYHKPTDTIETIDPVRFTLVVKGVAGAAWKIAGEGLRAAPRE